MKKKLLIALCAGFMTCQMVYAQNPLESTDVKCKQLTPKMSETITYDSKIFTLQWKSNAFCGFHKYEYFSEDMKGNFLNYKDMLIIDINQNLSGLPPVSVKSFIGSKARMVKDLKKTDPVANFSIYENKKLEESAIDFVMTGKVKDVDVSEWNFYRAKDIMKTGNKSSLIVFAISRRVYDNDPDKREQFRQMLLGKNAKIEKFSALDMPKPF